MRKRYIIKRLLNVIPVALGVLIVIFILLRSMPGDFSSALLGPEATAEDVARIRAQYGLDQNIFIQLFSYFKQLLSFNFGDSVIFKTPVIDMIKTAFPATLELSIMGMFWALLISIPLGILSAVKQNSWLDNTSMVFAQIGISMPVFWMGLLMILLFSVRLNWLPSFGRGAPLLPALWAGITSGDFSAFINSFKKILMPSFALGFMGSAMISRMIRSTMLDVLDMDYIRTARAKGTAETKVIMKHAFRNALPPVLTIVALQFGAMLGGSIVTETVFSWPGIGQVIVTAILNRDYPVVQAAVFIIAILFILINLIVDLLYSVINPKISDS
ncbi:MAG: ABC transporter permease [Saccharofermentanales bacterium]|jgi:peptide/nickel transport system permease protein